MPRSASDGCSYYLRPQPRHHRRDDRRVRRGLIFLTCCVLANSLFGEAGLAATMRARRDYAAGQEQLRTLKETNAGLREQVRRLSSEPAAIEDVARRELRLIRPGEVLFVIRNVP